MDCIAGPMLMVLTLALALALASSLPALPASPREGAPCSLRQTQAGPTADCSGRGLTQVPQNLPPSLASLDLCGNSFTELTNQSFSRYPSLRRLDVCSNRDLSRIDPRAFQPLTHLQELSLDSDNSLSWEMVFGFLQSFRNRSLTSIDLDKVHYVDRGMEKPTSNIVDENLTKVLADVCVSRLSLRRNYMIYMNFAPLFRGKFRDCAKHVDLSNNPLHGMLPFLASISALRNLESLTIQRDTPTKILTRADVKNPDPFNKKVIHISDADQTLVYRMPRRLAHFNFDGYGGNVPLRLNIRFLHAQELKSVIASRNGLNTFLHPIWGLEHLQRLDVSGNDLSLVAPEIFDTFPNLTHLNLSGGFLSQQFLLDWGQRLFQPLTRLQEIDLSNNDLSQLPAAPFPPARRVYLSSNHFSAVPFNLSRLPYLEELDLTFNAISLLSQAEMTALDGLASRGHNVSLRLFGNPLACDCSALDFLTWLQTTAVRLDRDGDLPCLTGAKTYSTTRQVLARARGRMWQRCWARFWLVFSGVGLTLVLLLTVLVWLGAKFWSQVQHVLLRMLGVGGAGRGRQEFRYDAYLAHSDSQEDVALAYGELRHLLEGRGGVCLFLRERETLPAALPGASRAEGIVEGVHACWRTLVLLTPHFLQDEWCDFTVAVAVRTLDWRMPGRLLLLLAAPLSKADIPQTLLSAVEEEDVFLISGRGQDDPVWDRLVTRILARAP